jgi:putative ABC transport system permease protein
MIRNLLITAIRNFSKNKFFSSLNILGLTIGMTVFLLIAQYVHFERSYEDFIPANRNIYRVKLEMFRNNELLMASAENYPGVGPAMQTEFPEVIGYARLYNMGYKNNVIITNENAKPEPIAFRQRNFLYADSTFLPMMGYEMLKGDAISALKEPFTAVISAKYAKMYFGNEDPIGKTLRLRDDDFNNELVKVTGVFKDLPSNTHLKFDVLISYNTLYSRGDGTWSIQRYKIGWGRKDMYTFIQLRPGTDPAKIEARLPSIVAKYKPELKESQIKETLGLQPLSTIHLHSDLTEEQQTNGNARAVFFLSLIGMFVLIIAWINYINLSTARALERAKEVGVRKVVGAFKSQLIAQFLTEAALVNLFSVLLAWGLAFFSLRVFNRLSGLTLDSTYLLQPWFLFLLILLWLAGGLLSGFYPALVLSSFKPISVLKGKLTSNRKGILLRKGLVVVQFIASISLIAGTFIIYRQLKFMTSKDMGMSIKQVMVIERPGIADTSQQVYNSHIDAFKNELKKDPTVEAAAASFTIPGKQREYKVIIKRLGNDTDSTIVRFNSMDYDFLDVFKMKLLAGRNFSKDFPSDPDTSVMITATAARQLGFKTMEEAVGKTLNIPAFGGWKPIIVGVVNDYHQLSLKKPLDPSIFNCAPYQGEYYSLRLNTTNMARTIKNIEKSWSVAFAGNPFEYFFLDEYFDRQYVNEQRFEKLFVSFALLAIVIGCIGLFGLSAYTASQRIKEIGIRKVLGASVPDITKMLSRDFLKLILLAIVIASPLAWWAMNNWLQDFAYRIRISWWIFAAAGIIALLIAMFTVSLQAVKAAIANPVKSLRTE